MRSTDCGLRLADCGLDTRPSNPQSAIHNPQWLAGALLLALLPPPVGAQQPDSTVRGTTSLPPVVVTGVRLPTVRELARGLAGRTATLNVQDLDARGVRSLADALEQLPGGSGLGARVKIGARRGGVPARRELGASAGSWGRYELKAHAGARHSVWDYYLGARYEHETGWRQDTRSRIGTVFAKVGLLN